MMYKATEFSDDEVGYILAGLVILKKEYTGMKGKEDNIIIDNIIVQISNSKIFYGGNI